MRKLQTIAVREAIETSQYLEQSEAMYLSSSFKSRSAAEAARRFANEEAGYIYSRFSNPTVDSFQRRLAALEEGESCLATSSGMSALLLLILGLLKQGDHVVCAKEVFGATLKMFSSIFSNFGIQVTYVTLSDTDAWRKALLPNTRMFFFETPSNPLTQIGDIAAISDIAHKVQVCVVVDNCFCTPALQKPLLLGADIVLHSATKFIDGQGRVIGGAVVGSEEVMTEKLLPVLRSAGMTLSAFNAWIFLKGCETLDLRVRAQSATASKIAQWLSVHPAVKCVHYPGLLSHPQHQLAMQQQSGVGGAVVSFEVKQKSSDETERMAAWRVIDHTQICSITANLGDTKTMITHPATTSHGRLTQQERESAGIRESLVRVAVGLEDYEDICEDLARALVTE